MLHRSVEASLANKVRGVVTLVVSRGKFDIDAQSHIVATRRHLPQNVVSVRTRLAQLEIRWADFMRRSAHEVTSKRKPANNRTLALTLTRGGNIC